MHYVRTGIAPHHLIQHDFRQLDIAEKLRTNWDIERLILLQSVQGHAHEGHCSFHGKRYPNTSIDDIAKALHLDPIWVRTERQNLIDEIYAYVDKVISGETDLPLTNGEGLGFLGSSMFSNLDVSCHDVLRGLYLGGLRDSTETRFAMESKYGITIGGGKCFLVDTKLMEEMGLNGDILAHGAHEDMIDYYRDRGLIVGDSGPDDGNLEYMYIRFRRGFGASDDTAIVAAGLIYGFGTAVGMFLADAIDTIEKHVPVFSDQDQLLAKKIEKSYSKLDVGALEAQHMAYLSAVPENCCISVPDSSLRHMMLVDRKHDMTAIESHFLFVQGKRYAPIRIGHEEVLNRDFYGYVSDRIYNSPGVLK